MLDALDRGRGSAGRLCYRSDAQTVLQGLLVRNTVADHVVDRGADRLREAFVVERRGDGLLHIDDVVMADAVQLYGGNAGLDVFGDHFQDFGGQFAGDTHFCDVLGGFEGDGHSGSLRALALIIRIAGVL